VTASTNSPHDGVNDDINLNEAEEEDKDKQGEVSNEISLVIASSTDSADFNLSINIDRGDEIVSEANEEEKEINGQDIQEVEMNQRESIRKV
jgi:hypothetical protein